MLFNKKHTFYVLTNALYPDTILTITNKKEQCIEYYHKYLKYKHMHTFIEWCDMWRLDMDDFNSWLDYYTKRISSAETSQYKIDTVKYSSEELAGLFRLFSDCELLNCSYETQFEYDMRKIGDMKSGS